MTNKEEIECINEVLDEWEEDEEGLFPSGNTLELFLNILCKMRKTGKLNLTSKIGEIK